MADNTANKRIAKNSIFLSIRMVIVLLVGLYTTRAVLQLLGVEDYGVYNVVCGFVSMFAFLNTSMINGIQRFFNYEFGKNGVEGANKVFNTALFIQVILVLVIVILTESFGLWYLHNKMVIPEDRIAAAEWIFQFSILSFVFVILQVPFGAAIMAHERMDYYAIVQIVDAFLKLAIVFIVPLFHSDNLIWYGLLWSLISAFDFFMYSFYARKEFEEIRLLKTFNKEQFKSMLSFSGWNLFGSLSGVMKEQGINLVLNLFFGPIVNAARGVASQVNGGLQGFASNIMLPVRPQVVQSYARGEIDRTLSLTYSVSKLSCYILYIMGLPILVELDYILNVWLGGNVPEHTKMFILIIYMTTLVSALNSAISSVVHASGKMMLYQVVGGSIGISSVPVAFLISKLGGTPEFAMLGGSIVLILGHIVGLFILKTIVKFSVIDYLKKVVTPIFLVVVTTFFVPLILYYSMEEGIIRLVLNGILCVTFVSLSVYFVGLNKTEREMINSLLRKFKKS